MKRATLILLTAIYLLSNLGLTVNSYYCCGVLLSTSLSPGPKHHDGCKMASDGCCKTKKQYLKLKDRHWGEPGFNLNVKLFPALDILSPYFTTHTWLNNHNKQVISYNNHRPPDRLKTSVYIFNCTYLIWVILCLTAASAAWLAFPVDLSECHVSTRSFRLKLFIDPLTQGVHKWR